ncbi:MAG: hypothetical protein E7352_03575 [Clostridiales bacterium]|nr:hypothetical protein [Clostridiales bacterium]MBE5747240.1 hypothetical protein [Clostridiales bacterium]
MFLPFKKQSNLSYRIIPIRQVVEKIERSYGVTLFHLSPKRIFFITKDRELCLCSPSSKFYKTVNRYWVDITIKQKEILDSYKKSLLVFRLENEQIFFVEWTRLSPLLTSKTMQYNTHEQYHWKLYIYNDYIHVGKSKNILSGEIEPFANWRKNEN